MKSAEEFLKNYNQPVKKEIKIEIDETLKEKDQLKTKILKYVLYKKRTQQEVRQKFETYQNENLLEDVIEELKQNGYINDENYVQRAVNEFIALRTFSMKELKNKLYTKGLSSDIIDTYFTNHQEQLRNYEVNSAKKLILKKMHQIDEKDLQMFLYKKGYSSESVKIALEQIDEGAT